MRQVFIRVYRLEIQSVMLVFSTQLSELLPLLPSLWFNSPPLPLPWVKVQYIQTVCDLEGGGGVSSPVGDHILQEFNTLYLTRIRTTKLLDHPKQKPRRGGGLRQIHTCRKVPLQVIFLDDDSLLCCLRS